MIPSYSIDIFPPAFPFQKAGGHVAGSVHGAAVVVRQGGIRCLSGTRGMGRMRSLAAVECRRFAGLRRRVARDMRGGGSYGAGQYGTVEGIPLHAVWVGDGFAPFRTRDVCLVGYALFAR